MLIRSSGIPWLVRELVQRHRVTIVVYHRLAQDFADRHFAALCRSYTPITLEMYLSARRTKSLHQLPAKSIIVTVDDGHKSIYQLKRLSMKYRVPLTVFLCSDLIGTARWFWFSAAGLNPSQIQYLKTVPDQTRLEVLRAINFAPLMEFEERECLSVEEILELLPIADFQSHSMSHPILPACSQEHAAEEIELSKEKLEKQLNCSINAFAYPNGSYSAREIDLTRKAGYECGLTMDPGFNDAATPLFALKRIALRDDCGIHELMVRTCGLWAVLRALTNAAAMLTTQRFAVNSRFKHKVATRT